MILSSDKLSGLGKPVVQVKLDTASTQDGSINAHLLEMDLKELNGLLKTLKSAQAVSYIRLHIDSARIKLRQYSR